MVTTANKIMLGSSSGDLTLTTDENGVGGWCQVQLRVPDGSRPLGAERLKGIAARIKSFLSDPAAALRWVFNLSELHTSVYGEHVGGGAILHFQDANGEMFAELALTPAEKSDWLEILSRLPSLPM